MAENKLLISNWHKLIEGLHVPPQEFYAAVEQAIQRRNLPDKELGRVTYAESGIFSAKREYLRAQRKELLFDICAAPYGTGFFVSWWLAEKQGGLLALIAAFPLIGQFVANILRRLFQPWTYYSADTTAMFQSSIHTSVLEVIDQVCTQKGVQLMLPEERKPVLRDFYKKN